MKEHASSEWLHCYAAIASKDLGGGGALKRKHTTSQIHTTRLVLNIEKLQFAIFFYNTIFISTVNVNDLLTLLLKNPYDCL